VVDHVEQVDAVVIGAGHNGLVAANVLADAGWSVAVLEATPSPGGAVRSAELTAPGYLSDLCSAFYPLGFVSPALRRLDLGSHGLRWQRAPAALAHILPDDRVAVIERDASATAGGLDAFAPGDGQRWLDAAAQWETIGPPLLDVLLGSFPPVRAGLRLARTLRTGGTLRLLRRMLLPARRLSAELFAGDGARLLLAGCAAHTDLTPDEASSGVYGWLLAMLAQQHGFPVVQGGAQRLTDALVGRLGSLGGQVRCGQPVEQVVVRNGRAVGVVVGGQAMRASRAVVADVPAPVLYRDLVGLAHLPPRLAQDLAAFAWDNSTIKVDWALSGQVPWSNPAAGPAGTVHLGASMDGLSDYGTDLNCGRVPTHPFILAGQMSTADPTRSPAGTEVLWAYSHLPRRDTYRPDEVEEHADRLQDTIEAHAPGLSNLIVGRRVTGPHELETENPSLVGGAIAGGTAAAHQQLVLRPIPGLGRADTPIDRLYLGSASAHPGGAVHGVAGDNAARAALARDRPLTGSLYHGGVVAALRRVYREGSL
jgi:phytoene dehydrogenase-like protein